MHRQINETETSNNNHIEEHKEHLTMFAPLFVHENDENVVRSGMSRHMLDLQDLVDDLSFTEEYDGEGSMEPSSRKLFEKYAEHDRKRHVFGDQFMQHQQSKPRKGGDDMNPLAREVFAQQAQQHVQQHTQHLNGDNMESSARGAFAQQAKHAQQQHAQQHTQHLNDDNMESSARGAFAQHAQQHAQQHIQHLNGDNIEQFVDYMYSNGGYNMDPSPREVYKFEHSPRQTFGQYDKYDDRDNMK